MVIRLMLEAYKKKKKKEISLMLEQPVNGVEITDLITGDGFQKVS